DLVCPLVVRVHRHIEKNREDPVIAVLAVNESLEIASGDHVRPLRVGGGCVNRTSPAGSAILLPISAPAHQPSRRRAGAANAPPTANCLPRRYPLCSARLPPHSG